MKKQKDAKKKRVRYTGDVFKPLAYATIAEGCGDDPEFAEFSDGTLRDVLDDSPQWVATYRLVSVRRLHLGRKPIKRG